MTAIYCPPLLILAWTDRTFCRCNPVGSLRQRCVHQCGVRTDGAVECLGSNAFGELGAAMPILELINPIQVGTENDWSSVAVGYTHSCGIRTGGTLYCWGRNHNGEIGDGTAWWGGAP